MQRLAFHVAAGAAALVLLDYVAIGNSAAVSTAPAGDQSVVVNRVTKGDRQDRGGSSVQLKLTPSRQTAPAGREVPQPLKQETKVPEGCELAVSPLAESAGSGSPARCVS